MTTHRITNADNVRSGNAVNANRSLFGVPHKNLVAESFTPVVAAAAALAASQTVTGAGTAFVLNGGVVTAGVGVFDFARNVVAAWTNTAVITITGFDVHGAPLKEVSASGTSHAGVKAFKRITSITTSATITGATAGSGAVLGLTYRPIIGGFIRGILNENTSDSGTYVAPIRTTSTSTSADVRGTYAYAGTANGANRFTVLYVADNGPQDTDAFGIAQFNG